MNKDWNIIIEHDVRNIESMLIVAGEVLGRTIRVLLMEDIGICIIRIMIIDQGWKILPLTAEWVQMAARMD